MGIAHRDIKLENILLQADLSIAITDFGCAAKCRSEDKKAIEFDSSAVAGSREYNAPEMRSKDTYNGEEVDIFAAGVCLFYLILGCPPFGEASEHDPAFLRLAKKDKSSYWTIFHKLPTSPEFKGNLIIVNEG